MTNGEKIQTILNVDRDCVEVHGENGTMTFSVTQDFWNAEYKEPTTKNNLAVDAVSRAYLLDDSKYHTVFNDDTGNFEDVVYREDIEKAPSATPQEPRKGHWIDTKENSTNTRGQIIHEVICSECNGIAYFRSIGNKYIGANICPNCSADMRKVEE